jgi:L-aminopeptidase/D-esterase-like protein
VSGQLPDGFRVGHWSDHEGWTGCTVVLAPEGAVGACEVRGGGPGTRESDLLSPAGTASGPNAVLLTGGSAFGLAAAEGVVRWLAERGQGFRTPAGVVPLVAGAVVFDLALGDAEARPDAEAGYAACEAASAGEPARGTIGVGTGCTVGKLLGGDGWTKGGIGLAFESLADGTTVASLAAVNAFGDVLAEDGSVLAGVRRGGKYARTTDLLAAGEQLVRTWDGSTTLVCVLTDAALTKTQAWLVARAAGSGVARTVDPCATAVDGDVVYCVASGQMEADPVALSALAARAVAASVRDAVREATSAPGCPAAAEAGAESE